MVAQILASGTDNTTTGRAGPVCEEDRSLRGRIALSPAHLAHDAHTELHTGSRWEAIARDHPGVGAQRLAGPPRRPRTTGTPTPATSPTSRFPGSINTMPEETLLAVDDHGAVPSEPLGADAPDARAALRALDALGISFEETASRLETERWPDSRARGGKLRRFCSPVWKRCKSGTGEPSGGRHGFGIAVDGDATLASTDAEGAASSPPARPRRHRTDHTSGERTGRAASAVRTGVALSSTAAASRRVLLPPGRERAGRPGGRWAGQAADRRRTARSRCCRTIPRPVHSW